VLIHFVTEEQQVQSTSRQVVELVHLLTIGAAAFFQHKTLLVYPLEYLIP
jgi:hypothetical protein